MWRCGLARPKRCRVARTETASRDKVLRGRLNETADPSVATPAVLTDDLVMTAVCRTDGARFGSAAKEKAGKMELARSGKLQENLSGPER